MEKEIRDSSLARLLPNLTKSQIENVVKRHNNRFTPKYKAFSILQNKIEEVINQSTRLWKFFYKKIDDVFDKKIEVDKDEEKEEEMNKGDEQE